LTAKTKLAMAPRLGNRLIPVNVDRIKRPGMHPDGHGLYLRAGPNGAKSWVLRYKVSGKRREMGLGGYPIVSLAEAPRQSQPNSAFGERGMV
jgi:hypothetical protein